MTGQRLGSVALVADGATVLVHGAGFADALATLAEYDPRVAAMLENLVKFGPYGMVVSFMVLMGAQFYRNHNEEMAPVLSAFGAVSPETIIAQAGLEMPVPVSSNGGKAASESQAENPIT
jgi:hypothetical protein